jgi:hypothetical protein
MFIASALHRYPQHACHDAFHEEAYQQVSPNSFLLIAKRAKKRQLPD